MMVTKCSCGQPLSTHARRSLVVLSRYDPTNTTTLRNDFAREMRKRFYMLRGVIRKAIVDEDCFGFTKANEGLTALAMSTPGPGAFAFKHLGAKLEAFDTWLQAQIDRGILEVTASDQLGGSIVQGWTDKYINSAYRKGVEDARQQLIKHGYPVPTLDETGGIEIAMAQPMHIERVGLLYTRAFSELKGITAAMDHQISRVLAQSMAEGRHPREMARLLTRTISGPDGGLGLTDTLGRFIPAQRRAEMLARTEVIRAHHTANIQEYRNWGAAGVKVRAEWVTAGYNVCDECAGLEGTQYSLDEIEHMIPVHPNCRCMAIPVDVKEAETRKAMGETPAPALAPKAVPKKPKTLPWQKPFKKTRAQDFEAKEYYKGKIGEGGHLTPSHKAWMQAAHDRVTQESIEEMGMSAALKSKVQESISKALANDTDFKALIHRLYDPKMSVKNGTRELIHQWAATSFDTNNASALLQLAAKEEFGLTKAALGHRSATMESLTQWLGTGARAESVKRGARKFLRTMYDQTQEVFKSYGVKDLTVYRGIQGVPKEVFAGKKMIEVTKGIAHKISNESFRDFLESAYARMGKNLEVSMGYGKHQTQPMSSFAMDIRSCSQFRGASSEGAYLLARVPVERIIGFPGTGFGCFIEDEVVVLGGIDEYFVVWDNGLLNPLRLRHIAGAVEYFR